MNEKHIQILGIALVVAGLGFISFVYMTQPRTLAEVATKGSVAIGTYQINKEEFARGLGQFRAEDFAGARLAFDRADPEKLDAETQFYIAYSYYRQGWGRVSNDDVLFAKGIESVDRAIAVSPNFRSDDSTLLIRSPTELRTELEEGIRLTPSDLNPLKLIRERK